MYAKAELHHKCTINEGFTTPLGKCKEAKKKKRREITAQQQSTAVCGEL